MELKALPDDEVFGGDRRAEIECFRGFDAVFEMLVEEEHVFACEV